MTSMSDDKDHAAIHAKLDRLEEKLDVLVEVHPSLGFSEQWLSAEARFTGYDIMVIRGVFGCLIVVLLGMILFKVW